MLEDMLHDARRQLAVSRQRECSAMERLGEVTNELEERKQEVNQLKKKADTDSVRRAQMEHLLARVKARSQETDELLKARTDELREVQAAVSTTDETSDAEVLELIEKINSISFQTSATIADTMEPACGKRHNVRVVEEARRQLASTKLLSDRMIEALSTADHTATACFLVQTALQAIMVGHAKKLCSKWDSLYGTSLHFLSKLHHHMKGNGTHLTTQCSWIRDSWITFNSCRAPGNIWTVEVTMSDAPHEPSAL